MKRIYSFLWAFLLAATAYSQNAEMADAMRMEGKIYVVVTILLVILVGLILYLIRIDRKTAGLEKKINENKPS